MINRCPECLEKQQKIDKLLEENQRLKTKLGREERKATEGYFGSQTPSSKIPIKKATLEENQKKRGGGKKGHKGHGRKKISNEEADHIREIEVAQDGCCPHCQGKDLRDIESEDRSVIESVPVKAEKIIYRLKGKLCLGCHKIVRAKAPSVMPKSLYGNQLATHVAIMHYVHGTPLGRMEEQLQIPYSAMVEIMHRLGRIFNNVVPNLITEYRQSPAKHADETGWRTDGGNGYAWLFATKNLSIFEFRNTRSAIVPASILGNKHLPGVLVVDRYQGYNRAPCEIQYCYAHLLRHLQDLEKEHPEREEIRVFVATVAPLLSLAMNLRNQPISDEEFYKQAKKLAKQIQGIMKKPAVDLGIRAYQDLFRDNRKRLYHWANDRLVPADNNLAERDLRPTVIARKVSFGSQSEAGAKTRGILMSVLVTLKKRYPEDYSERFKNVLDQFSLNPDLELYRVLFPP